MAMPRRDEQGQEGAERERQTQARPPQKAKHGRGVKILLAGLVCAVALYSGVWYFLAKRAEENVAGLIRRAAQDGVDIRCNSLRKSGYPLRIAIACAGLSVDAAQDGSPTPPAPLGSAALDGRLAFRSGGLTAGAPVYAPHWLSFAMGAPALLKLPHARSIEGDWQRLQCEGDFAAKPPRNLSLSVEKPVIGNLPFLAAGAALSADFIRFDSKRLSNDKAALALSFDALSLPLPLGPGQDILPKADGSLDIVFDDAAAFYADLPQLLQTRSAALLRGQSGLLNKAVLSFENGGGVTLSGPFSVAESGRLSGKITIEVNDPPALLRTIRAVVPAQADNLESLFFVLSSMPKNAKGEPQLQLEIENGRMRIGFLKLGKIPPL